MLRFAQCTRPELLSVLQTLQRIAEEFAFLRKSADTGLESKVLNKAILSLPTISDDVVGYLDKINPEAAKNDDRYSFFRADQETEDITEHNLV